MQHTHLNNDNYKYINNYIHNFINIIEINNPPNNLLSIEVMHEMKKCIDQVLEENDSTVIIITGKGRNFSKGADLVQIEKNKNVIDSSLLYFFNNVLKSIYNSHKLCIAAINGACLGGGLEISLACHLRLASENAMVGLPETSIGIIPGLGGFHRMRALIGEAKALELVLMGDIISAQRASELHLINKIFPKKVFMHTCIEYVKSLMNTKQQCIKEIIMLNKHMRNNGLDDNSMTDLTIDSFLKLLKSNE